MAAFVQDVVTFNTTAGNKTAVITPALNGLLVVCCGISGTAVQVSVTDDQGGSYTLIQTANRNSNVATSGLFVRDGLVRSAVAHSVLMTSPGGDSGGGLDVIEVSGMSRVGANAIRSSGRTQNIAAGAAVAVTMNQAAASNMVIAFVVANDNGVTVTNPTNYTARNTGSYTAPTTGLEVNTRDSGETTATVTWGGTTTSAASAIAVELDPSGMTFHPPIFEPAPFIPRGRSM